MSGNYVFVEEIYIKQKKALLRFRGRNFDNERLLHKQSLQIV